MPTIAKPLPYVWPWALLFWGVFLWSYWPEMRIIRRARREQGSTDAKSLQVITLSQSLAFFAAFAVAGVRALRFAPRWQLPVFCLGVTTIVAASLLRRHCWRMLGASFTGDVRARADQVVVTRGAYRLLRHPSYTAGIMLSTGVGLALGSWGSALILAVVATAGYVYRINVEERALLAAIGEPYREFIATRKRLIPFLY